MAKAPLFSPGVTDEPFAVVPSDSADHIKPCRYYYIGTSGNVVLVTLAGQTVTYKNVPAGGYILAAGKRINSTSTTATDIVGHP